MNCDKAISELYEYLDGESGTVTRWRMRRHLRECPPCEDGAVFEARLRLRVRTSCREEIPPELEQRLRAFIRQQQKGTEA
jgi:anti-sigma factor (TIGR02949 family)